MLGVFFVASAFEVMFTSLPYFCISAFLLTALLGVFWFNFRKMPEKEGMLWGKDFDGDVYSDWD